MTLPSPTIAPSRAGLLAVILGIALLSHLVFLVIDPRLPRDPGLYYQDLPLLVRALESGEFLRQLGGVLLRPGGWYNTLLALGTTLAGGRSFAYDLAGLLSLLGTAAGTAWLARRHGAPEGLAAAMVVSTPMVALTARYGWIHVPETALLLACWWAIEKEKVWVAGIVGAGVLALRPSALIWLFPLIFVVWNTNFRWRVLGLWGVGALPLAARLLPYLGAKLEARARYFATLPEIWDQIWVGMGSGVLLLFLAGLPLGLRRWSQSTITLRWWMVAPLPLNLIFGAGFDNFTPWVPALSVWAAIGIGALGPWPRRIAAMLVTGIFLSFQMGAWLPEAPPVPGPPPEGGPPPKPMEGEGPMKRELPPGGRPMGQGASGPPAGDSRNWYRPCMDCIDPEIIRLLQASCLPVPSTCTIGVDQGLMQPYAEDPGFLPLYFAGGTHSRLLHARQPPEELSGLYLNALVQYDCGPDDAPYRQRYPYSKGIVQKWRREQHLEPVWARQTDSGCRLEWLTPDGKWVDPAAAPPSGEPIPPGADGG